MRIEEKEYITFDDVLIKPMYSEIESRKDVDLSSNIFGHKNPLKLPVFSANMDTITGVDMAKTMTNLGGMGVLHRFWSIEENVEAFVQTGAAVCVGLGEAELKRAVALRSAGAEIFFIDVAHGASKAVVNQLTWLKDNMCAKVIVGNFASKESLQDFLMICQTRDVIPDAVKIGVGPGSACTTRIKTGVGVPQLSAVMECASLGIPVIADGGMRTPGDVAKAIAAGAQAVMIGGMLAGTSETPGPLIEQVEENGIYFYKKYRGSASAESYTSQNKESEWRTAEGESFFVTHKGTAVKVLRDIEGGLRSSFSYVGAKNLKEFQDKVVFVRVSRSTSQENGAHGMK